MKKLLWIMLPLVGILMPLCAYWAVSSAAASSAAAGGYILIDPGHGGEDGGTVASDGTAEKSINLSIGADLYDLFYIWGYHVKATRLTDISLGDPQLSSVRQRKVSDMKARLEEYNAATAVISIHQNHFSVAKYSGVQVFYSPNTVSSQALADAIRSRVIGGLQPDNNREQKQATDGIYLLYHAKKPAVLVECGFLSNPEECEKLKTAEYQQQMAFAIFQGWLQYSDELS